MKVAVLVLLGLFKEVELQTVAALVANRQIGKKEIASLLRPVKIRHTRDGHSCQHWRRVGSGRLHTSMGNDAGVFQSGVEEEIGIVEKGDVLGVFLARAFKDTQLNDGWRVDGSAIRR